MKELKIALEMHNEITMHFSFDLLTPQGPELFQNLQNALCSDGESKCIVFVGKLNSLVNLNFEFLKEKQWPLDEFISVLKNEMSPS